jgi:hypothetical protein
MELCARSILADHSGVGLFNHHKRVSRTWRLVGLGSGLGDNLRWLTEPPVTALS